MATLDSSPSQFIGQPWSSWVGDKKEDTKDGDDGEKDDEEDKKEIFQTLKLKKEEKWLFGVCPAQDEFYLVICEACGQVVKPQALQRHIDARHGGLSGKVEDFPVSKRHSRSSQYKLNSTSNLNKIRKNNAQSLPVVNLTRLASSTTSQPELRESSPVNSTSNNTDENSWDELKPISVLPNSSFCNDAKPEKSPPPLPAPERQENGPPLPPLLQCDTGGTQRQMKEVIIAIPSPKGSENEDDFDDFSRIIISPETHTAGNVVHVETVAKTGDVTPTSLVSPTIHPPVTTHLSTTRPPPTLVSHQATIVKSYSVATTTAVTTTASSTPVTSVVSSKLTPTSALLQRSHSSGGKKKSKGPKDEKFIPCKLREYDPERHCGVLCPELDKHCTRSLTCKTHSLFLRRAVPGRSKTFDELLKDHKDAKELKLKKKSESEHGSDLNLSSSSLSLSPPILHSQLSHKPPDSPQLHKSHNSLSINTNQSTGNFLQSPPSMHSPPWSPLHPVAAGGLARSSTTRLVVNPLLTKPSSAPVFPRPDHLLPMELAGDSTSCDDDDDDDGDEGVPLISHHPRPLAVNNFGAWRHGKGCFMFNRREDLYRAAFMAAVEKHLHPPPHKKLCVESKLPRDSSVTANQTDPYEFGTPGEQSDTHHHKHHSKSDSRSSHHTSPKLSKSSSSSSKASSSSSKPSSKSSSASSHKSSSSKSDSHSSSSKTEGHRHSSSSSSKRKRSSTSSATTTTSSPISIAIPTSSLALGSQPIASLGGDGHKTKDLAPTVINGQLLGIAGTSSHQTTHYQLNNSTKSSRPTSFKSKLSSSMTSGVNSQGQFLISPSSVTMISPGLSSVSNGNLSVINRTSPSQQLNRAESESPLSSAPSPLPNGILSPPLLHYSAPLDDPLTGNIPSPSTDFSDQLLVQTSAGIGLSLNTGRHSASRHSKKPSSSELPLSNAQQLAAAALNLHPTPTSHATQLYPANRLNTSAKPFSTLQFQSKANVPGNSGKITPIQPVSLTIVPTTVGGQSPQARRLIRSDDRHKQLQSTSSNVFS